MSAPFAALGRWIADHRGLALALILLLTMVTGGLGLARVLHAGPPVDFTPQAVFMDGGEEVLQVERVAQIFGRDDNDLVFLVQGDLAAPAGRAALLGVHEALEADPRVERVESLVNATTVRPADGLLEVLALWDDLPPSEALAVAATDPVLSRLLVSEDGGTTAIRARVDRSLERVGDLSPVVWELVETVEAVPRPDDLTVRATGVPYVRAEVVGLMWESQLFYIPVVGGTFALVICLLFRRVALGLAPLIAVLIADVWAVGGLVAAGQVLNILSILVPTLVLVIGVADGIHIAERYREELASGHDRREALGRTLQAMALPCFLTTFTTAAGFLSLVVAETSVIRGFGVQASVAMVITFFAVIVVLPVLLAWIPVDRVPPPPNPGRLGGALDTWLLWLDDRVAARPGRVLVGCVVVTLLALGVGSGVRTNSRLLELYQPGMPTYEAIQVAQSELSGVVPVFLYVETSEPDGLLEPAVLQAMKTVEDELRSRGPVLWTTSLASQVARLNGILADDPTIPATRTAVAQELLVAEMAGRELLDGMVDDARRRGRVLVMMSDAGGREYMAIQSEVSALAAAQLDPLGVDWALTGDGFLAAGGIDALISDLLSSLGLVFLVIVAVFGALLRDAKLTVLAVVPNLVPLVFTLATLGLMGADLQTSNVVSFTVAVGLAVDDTIHFIVRYQQERAAHDLRQAVTRTFRGAGHAIVLTSLLLVLGFSTLSVSQLTSTRHFGILAAVTMAAALMADLLLLPALLHLSERRR